MVTLRSSLVGDGDGVEEGRDDVLSPADRVGDAVGVTVDAAPVDLTGSEGATGEAQAARPKASRGASSAEIRGGCMGRIIKRFEARAVLDRARICLS